MLGFKSEDAGRSRAKAGVMRRLSMVALRSTARHVLRGLAVVGPPCIHQHNARETARRAHHDAFGNDRGAPWRKSPRRPGRAPGEEGTLERPCTIRVGRDRCLVALAHAR